MQRVDQKTGLDLEVPNMKKPESLQRSRKEGDEKEKKSV